MLSLVYIGKKSEQLAQKDFSAVRTSYLVISLALLAISETICIIYYICLRRHNKVM